MLKKTLESPLDSKEVKPGKPKGYKFWIFIGRTNAEAEAAIIGQLMQRANSLEKTLMLGKIEDKKRINEYLTSFIIYKEFLFLAVFVVRA